ncbi:MAG TPA: hypothetical protein VGP64_08320 [Polyangia bacterium]
MSAAAVGSGCATNSEGGAPSGSGGESATGGGGAEGGTTGQGGSSGDTRSGGTTGSGGAKPSGGTTGSGGSTASGGNTGSGGAATTGGATGSGGAKPSGGTTGTGGTTAAGGATGSGGAKATGGTTGAGGTTGTGGTTATGGVTGSCGATALNEQPFGCAFAWGTNNPGGSLSSYSYLQFMSNWVGSEIQANGSITSCSGCTWLTNSVASTNLIPVFYAYFIGYLGHANGFPDQNTTGGASLASGGAYVIRKYRSQLIAAYTYYAQKAHAAWPTKPLVWLLEGDFVQYTDTTQVNYPNASGTNPGSPNTTTEALSYAELGQLAADITCAIKSNMPNAVVAINHSTWNADNVTQSFWGAMAGVNYDMAWTSGAGNIAGGFFTSGTTASSYNGKTATYAYLHSLTGKTIFVDTSFGASAMDDTWSDSPASTINARIADGVIAADVTTPPSNYSSAVNSLKSSLSMVCSK